MQTTKMHTVRKIAPRAQEGMFAGGHPAEEALAQKPAHIFQEDKAEKTSLITDPVAAIEAMVVSALLQHNDWFTFAASQLTESDFSNQITRTAFSLIGRTLKNPDSRIDEIMLAGEYEMIALASRNEIRDLAAMATTTTEQMFRSHVARVATNANERELQRAAKNAELLASNQKIDVSSRAAAIVDNIQNAIRVRETSFAPVEGTVIEVLDTIIQRAQSTTSLIGATTGFDGLDKLTLGFGAGDLVVVAGRPSMGKTAKALATIKANLNQGREAMFCSLEMRRSELFMRMLSAESGVPLQDIRRGSLTEQQWESVLVAAEKVKQWNLRLVDRARMTTDKIAAAAIECKQKGNLGLVVVDYLQLIETAGGATSNRADQVGAITRSLKLLAMELEVPVIALSQLNRSLEARPNKRPIMSDLRESGAIEQDADVVIFTYRDEVYNPDSQDAGVAEFIIGKQRNGPLGVVRVPFDADCATFRNETASIPLAPALADRIADIENKSGKRKVRQSKQPF